MATARLIVTGLSCERTPAELKKDLADLYQKPEAYFDDLCHSLFVQKQPYRLLESVEESVAAQHIERLEKLALTCDISHTEADLSLIPVTHDSPCSAVCPACEQETSGDEMCSQCGVIIKKYLQHKNFDEQLESRLAANANSHEQVDALQAEKSDKTRQLENARKLKSQANRKHSGGDRNDDDAQIGHGSAVITVNSKGTSNFPIYAAIASCCIALVGGAYFLTEYTSDTNNEQEAIAPVQTASVTSTMPSVTKVNDNPAADYQIPQDSDSVFAEQLDQKQKNTILSEKIQQYFAEDKPHTSAKLVAGQEHPRDQIFGQQETIRLGGLKEDSVSEMRAIEEQIGQLSNNASQVEALLNQATVYQQLELGAEAQRSLDAASAIANTVNDPAQQVLVETAFSEYHMDHDEWAEAGRRYQEAKKAASRIADSSDADSAFAFIAFSEAEHGLPDMSISTTKRIKANHIRASIARQIDPTRVYEEDTESPSLQAAHSASSRPSKLFRDEAGFVSGRL